MSLRVWLPLNGDLENKGLDGNISLYNNTGAIINENGKIGKCYYFDGVDDWINFNINKAQYSGHPLSFAAWVKCGTTRNRGQIIDLAADLVLGYNYDSTYNTIKFHYWRCYKNSSGIRVGDSSVTTLTYSPNKWYHVVSVFDQNLNKIYVDGELSQSFDSSLKYTENWQPLLNDSHNKLNIGKSSGDSNWGNMYVNDIRIYDHALSIKQIKEISKGLVLHYKLDDKYTESTVNLCNGLIKGRRTVVVGDIITNTGENADTYWYIKPKEALVGGATYTISCQLQGFSSNSDYISWGVCAQYGANFAGSWKTYNGYNEFTFVMPVGLDGSTANIIFDDNGGVRTQIFTISKIQLEKKNHATPYVGIGGIRNDNIMYDSSGYQNNGTIIGNIQITNDSPRYAVSTSFDGDTSTIQIPFNTSAWQTNFTINLWFKKQTLGSKGYETLFGGPPGFEMDTKAGNATTLSLYMASIRRSVYYPFNLNQWYMVTLVNNGINQLYYINSELKKTIEAKPMPTGNYFIGSWQTAIKQNYCGKISDFRIYATALSEEDIKQLYQTFVLIDRNQNLYVGEVIE